MAVRCSLCNTWRDVEKHDCKAVEARAPAIPQQDQAAVEAPAPATSQQDQAAVKTSDTPLETSEPKAS